MYIEDNTKPKEMSETEEGKKMNDLVNNFCGQWLNKDSDKFDEFVANTIDLVGELHKYYIIASVRNVTCGKNLYSEFKTLDSNIKDINSKLGSLVSEKETIRNTIKVDLSKAIKPSEGGGELGKFSSKAAKEYAEENNINPDDIVGTGKGDKITKTDIKNALGATAVKKRTTSGTNKLCCGTTAIGSVCKSNGYVNIQGKWFCKKHENQAVHTELDDKVEKYEEYDEIKDTPFKDTPVKNLNSVISGKPKKILIKKVPSLKKSSIVESSDEEDDVHSDNAELKEVDYTSD